MEKMLEKSLCDGENLNAKECLYHLQTNPLLIDTVLFHLVRYLDLDDLKNARLVHTSWNRAIKPRLRERCRVVLRPVAQDEWEELQLLAASNETEKTRIRSSGTNGQKALPNDINDRIALFTEVMICSLQIFGNSPFSEFKLIDFPFDTDIGIRFFEVCGRGIKNLDVRVNRKGRAKLPLLPASFGGDFYPDLLTVKAPFVKKLVLFPFPGLEKAEFTQVIPCLEGIHFKEWASKELLYPESFLENLFLKCVKLHEIWVSIGLENCKSVENILIAVATSGRYSFLTKLHIAYLRLSHLEILHELAVQRRGRLRLTSFRIEALAHDVPTSLYESFLRTQSVNLRELYCRRFLGSSKFGKLTFPRMIGLNKLDCELSARQVMPLRCNAKFPNLQTLNLFGTCCQLFSSDQHFTGNRISKSLVSLHFRPGVIVTGSISGLAECFPCLKSLTLSIVSSNDMKELLQCWETLEDLELYFGDGVTNIDSILTGIPAEQCSRLLQAIKNEESVENLMEVERDLWFSGNTSLRNFKNLKTLHFEYNAFLMSRNPLFNADVSAEQQEPSGLGENDTQNNDLDCAFEESYLPTDVTGYFALNLMKSLRKVTIPECLLTKKCCNTIIQNLNLVSWTFCSEASDIVPKA